MTAREVEVEIEAIAIAEVWLEKEFRLFGLSDKDTLLRRCESECVSTCDSSGGSGALKLSRINANERSDAIVQRVLMDNVGRRPCVICLFSRLEMSQLNAVRLDSPNKRLVWN